MDTTALVWVILFCVAAVLFFGVAVVITVVGFRDLRALLSSSKHVR